MSCLLCFVRSISATARGREILDSLLQLSFSFFFPIGFLGKQTEKRVWVWWEKMEGRFLTSGWVIVVAGTEKKSINPELWQACAGPLVNLPPAGTHVVYFPQGHSEQVGLCFISASCYFAPCQYDLLNLRPITASMNLCVYIFMKLMC